MVYSFNYSMNDFICQNTSSISNFFASLKLVYISYAQGLHNHFYFFSFSHSSRLPFLYYPIPGASEV